MEFYELLNEQNEWKRYRAYDIRPTRNALVRIVEPTSEALAELQATGSRKYEDLSFHKVYVVYKVINVKQILIKDDSGCGVHLYPSQYELVKQWME
ncbi:MAG: hypothetical protein ACI35R_02720 [Bacillus sp. (in: firmicutes)]